MSVWIRFALLLLLVIFGLCLAPEAKAQGLTAYDVIAAVNALRASQGLAPYQIDPWLMSYAQQHSEYCAKTGKSTHVHSDGSIPWQNGVQENVAAGDPIGMTVNRIVYEVWADPVHGKTMTGHATGLVGAGVAYGNGMIYVTLDVRPGDSSGTAAAKVSTPGSLIPEVPLQTTTPRPDGSIVHVVGYGQTLWSIAIAYGVKMDEIRNLNGMAADDTSIYAGQKLLICVKCPATPVPIATQTPSSTPTQTVARITPTRLPSATVAAPPTPVATQTPSAKLLTFERTQFVAILLAASCLGGLLVLGISKLRKK